MIPLTKLYETDEVFIVAGGPSAEGFIWSKLNDKFTIGCNKSAFVANTDVLFSVDTTFMGRFYKQMKDEYEGMICLAMRNYDAFANFQICDRQYIHHRNTSLSETHPNIYGLNTGHAAVNLALIEGFKTIHLIGCDMNVRGHWHSGYSWSRQNHDVMKAWAENLNDAKSILDDNGVTLYNYSPHSAVTAYPHKSLEDL